MNAIRQTQQLNRRELENATPPSASWHADYRDTAWIYVGGFPLDLSEGDVVTIFSQFGNPTHLNLIRDRETGKSKGFGFLKYEDQRSCDLAVDNLGGAEVLGRMLRVDHTRYKKRDDEDEDTYKIDRLEAESVAEQQAAKRASETESDDDRERKRRRRKEVRDGVKKLAITENGEEEDPMKDYLARERRGDSERGKDRERRHRHRDRRYRDDSYDGEDRKKRSERRHREDRVSRDDRVKEDRREHRRRRRSSQSISADSERGTERSSRRDDGTSRSKWKRGRSLSPGNEGVLNRDLSLEPSSKGKSAKPGRLKFKGDD